MKTVKILHTADFHIGAAESFLKTEASKRRFENLLTFEKIIDLGAQKNVDIIAIAGDLFDSNQIEERFIDAVFEKISSIKIPVVFCAGNHDPLNSDSPFLNRELPENLYVLGAEDECITFEGISLKCYGRSFTDVYLKGEEQFTVEASKDYVNLMVQHGELKSDLSSDYNSITPNFVKTSGMDYIALGHVHKKTPIGKIDNTYFAYCGCPEGQGFDELDDKGVYIGEIGKGVCNLEFIPVSRRKHIHHKTDITGLFSTEEICAKILNDLSLNYNENFRDNLYKIELTGEILPDTKVIKPEILSRLQNELYFVKLKDSTELQVDFEVLSKEPSLKGIFVKRMLEKLKAADENDKPLYKKALNLGLKAFLGEVKYDED